MKRLVNIGHKGIVLMVVCGISALLLTVTYAATRPLILEQREAALTANLRLALPAAERFELVDESEQGVIYRGFHGDAHRGFVVVWRQLGYAGEIEVVVGFNPDGTVATPIRILRHSETPGLGARVRDDWFRVQFAGAGEDRRLSVGDDVDGITGATISSQAVALAVGDALAQIVNIYSDDLISFDSIPDGVYRGQGTGYAGYIEVEVEIVQGRMVRIEVVDHYDVPEYMSEILTAIPGQMLESQGVRLSVDTFAGATKTTLGILEAVSNTLWSVDTDGPFDISSLSDGTYRGWSQGYGGRVYVEVEIHDGAIQRVQVVDHSEPFQATVDTMTQRILTQQDLELDSLTGATLTSRALISAVQKALTGAVKR